MPTWESSNSERSIEQCLVDISAGEAAGDKEVPYIFSDAPDSTFAVRGYIRKTGHGLKSYDSVVVSRWPLLLFSRSGFSAS